MARGTIKQRIALDGGAEIRKELLELGRAGEVVWAKLNKLSKQEIVPTTFQTRLAAIKGAYDSVATAGAKFGDGLKPIRKNASDLSDAVDRAGRTIRNIGIAVTGAVAGLVAFAKAAGDSGGAINDAAQKTGLSIEKYQTLSASAKQAGVDIGSFDAAFAKLNKAIASARDGGFMTKTVEDIDGVAVSVIRFKNVSSETTKEAQDLQKVFKDLGISVSDLRKLSNADILSKLQAAFAKLPDGPEKAAIAMKLFGRSGSELISFLNQGSKATKEFEDRMKTLGLVLSGDAVKSLDTLGDTTDDLVKSFGVLRDKIVASFADDLTSGANSLLKFLADNQQAIVDFVHYIGTEAAGIIKDFYNAFTGQGLDVNRPWVLEWTQAFKEFGAAANTVVFQVIIPAIETLKTAFQDIAATINAVFGTKLTGADVGIILVIAQVTGALGLLVPALTLTSTLITSLLLPGLRLVGVALLAMGGPLSVAVVGLAALAATIALNWGSIKKGFDEAFSPEQEGKARGFWENVGRGAAVVVHAVEGLGKAMSDAFTAASQGVEAKADGFWANVAKGAGIVVKSTKDIFKNLSDGFTNANIASQADGFWANVGRGAHVLMDFLDSVIEKLKAIFAAAQEVPAAIEPSDSGTGGSFGTGFASGGHVRGRGTGTSDSIPAYLSDYEFVVQARAVRKYGLSFLNALNAGRLKLPGYSTGGLVKSVQQFKFGLPAFSGGGLATLGNPMRNLIPRPAMAGSGMVPANIHIGGQSIPVMAQSSALQQLARAAGHKKLTTGGTKPSWYK